MNSVRRSSRFSSLIQLDQGLTRQLNRTLSLRGVQPFFAVISSLGDGKFWYTLMLVFPWLVHDHGLQAVGHMAIVGVVNLSLYRLIKTSTQRARPCHALEEISTGTAPLDEYSFPSGHTMHAVAFTIVASAWCPALLVPLTVFTVLVALSRVILGLHYPTDVVLGAMLGFLVARLSVTFVS